MKIKKNKGFTLLDALLWFAVFGVMVSVVYTKFTSGIADGRANNEIDAYNQASITTRQILQNVTYATVNDITSAVSSAGGFVKPLVISGASVVNPAGGGVTAKNESATTFSITSKSVPKNMCMDMATSILDYSQFAVGSGAATSRASVTPVTISNACSSELNDVTLTYTK